KRSIDFVTLGSQRPIRRLVAYYVVLAAFIAGLMYVFPVVNRLFSGERLEELSGGQEVLKDGLSGEKASTGITLQVKLPARVELAITTLLIMFGTLALMLPVSWVYMSVRRTQSFNQSVVQTLIILPIVVAGIILVVRNSLALAFSLAGVVSAVRFRTNLKEAGDVVFIFLAIAVGFALGVQTFTVGALVSIVFNFILLLVWRYDFGRNALEPTAASQWSELAELAGHDGKDQVPDRDLVVGLSPKNLEALTERFTRLRQILGPDGKKPRFNSILSVATNAVSETQEVVQGVLDQEVKRWKLDEVVTNRGKPSELYYLIRLGKSKSKSDLLTAIRSAAGNQVVAAEVEVGEVDDEEKKKAS
ncbi:MAG: DUF4956 domain-containing protein, partial [Gemmatimonadota bacterium]